MLTTTSQTTVPTARVAGRVRRAVPTSAHSTAARGARYLVLPALLFSIVLTQIPFLLTIVFSTLNWNQLRPDEIGFTGFSNYTAVFSSPEFVQSLWATVTITGSSVILSLLLGMGLALLMDRTFPGRAIARTLVITPFLVMPAAAALIWKWSMFDATSGILNWALSLVGAPPVAWNTDMPAATVIILLTWQFTPFMMLILLAGLQSQSREVLEAAAMDGAGALRVFGAITLPHLRPYVDIAVLLGTVMLIQVFDPVAIMTKGTGGSKTLPYLLYERAFIGLDVGQAAAFGVITVIITIVVATVALRTLFKVFMNGGTR
ncbi:MAG TPA: sugar ABC transporter permease [Pseudolysinimonas sp.]|nr:sugar ABC transporter permease [Pseudolysinimonas sp.]